MQTGGQTRDRNDTAPMKLCFVVLTEGLGLINSHITGHCFSTNSSLLPMRLLHLLQQTWSRRVVISEARQVSCVDVKGSSPLATGEFSINECFVAVS
jgi:hypothetical protein